MLLKTNQSVTIFKITVMRDRTCLVNISSCYRKEEGLNCGLHGRTNLQEISASSMVASSTFVKGVECVNAY